MSYTVTVKNSTGAPISTPDGKEIAPNDTWESGEIGNTYLHSDEFGSISFRDLGDKHIGGDSKETWGVLITYGGSRMVGRYEGGGRLTVTFDERLVATLGGMHLRHVHLDALIAEDESRVAPVKG